MGGGNGAAAGGNAKLNHKTSNPEPPGWVGGWHGGAGTNKRWGQAEEPRSSAQQGLVPAMAKAKVRARAQSARKSVQRIGGTGPIHPIKEPG